MQKVTRITVDSCLHWMIRAQQPQLAEAAAFCLLPKMSSSERSALFIYISAVKLLSLFVYRSISLSLT